MGPADSESPTRHDTMRRQRIAAVGTPIIVCGGRSAGGDGGGGDGEQDAICLRDRARLSRRNEASSVVLGAMSTHAPSEMTE